MVSDVKRIEQLHQIERRGKGLLECLLAEFERLPKKEQRRVRAATADAARLINHMTQTQLDEVARLRKERMN